MSLVRRAARWGASAALIAALAAPRAAAAQQPADSDFTDIIVQLRIERGPERTVAALERDSVVYVPLRAFLDLAEIRVTAALAGHRVAGILEPANEPFWIDTDAGSRGRGRGAEARTAALGPTDVVWRDDEAFVAAPIVGELVGVEFRMDWHELLLVVAQSDALPVRIRLEREARRSVQLAAASRLKARALPLLRLPDPVADGAVLDYGLSVGSHDPADNIGLQGGLGLTLAGGNLTYIANWQRANALASSSDMWSWVRAWPEGSLIRQARAGDIVMDGVRLRGIRGGVLTNAPFIRPADFGTGVYAGRFGPGWQVELGTGPQLLAYTTTDSAGRYRLDAPLVYGPNPAEIRAYGPHGEVVREPVAFDVPTDRLPSHRFEYVVGGGQCRADPCNDLMVADARYGISRRVTARLGAEAFWSDSLGDAWHPYAGLTASLTHALQASVDGTLHGVLNVRTVYNPTPDFRLDAGGAWFDTARSKVLFGAGADASRADAALFWRPGGGRLQLFGTLLAGHGTTNRSTWRLGPAVRISNALFGVTAHEERPGIVPGGGGVSSGADVSLLGLLGQGVPLLGGNLVNVTVGSGCAGALGSCEPAVNAVRAALGRQIGAALHVDASMEWHQGGATIYTLTLSTVLPYLRSYTRTGYSPDQAYTSTQAFEGSLLWDRRDGRVRFDDGRSVGFGGIAGVVFHDVNGNGVQDPGEDGVPGVLVRVGSRGIVTDSLGRFSSFDLPPFERAVVEVDTLGIPDPTWVPDVPAFYVRPAPNGYRFVPVPLVAGQELSGLVAFEGRGLAQIRVHAHNTESGQDVVLTTFDDGSFYAPAIRPGTWELTLDPELLDRLGAAIAPRRVTVRRDRAPAPVRLDLARREP